MVIAAWMPSTVAVLPTPATPIWAPWVMVIAPEPELARMPFCRPPALRADIVAVEAVVIPIEPEVLKASMPSWSPPMWI